MKPAASEVSGSTRASGEVRRIVTEQRRRVSPGFSLTRWQMVLLTGDPGFAEILVGLWLIGLRGLMLMEIGFSYSAVNTMLAEAYLTSNHIGLLLVACGVAQAIAAGTGYYRLRSALAFFGAVVCLAVWLAYLGSGLEQTAIAWTWAGLTSCEASLSLRILLSRLVILDQSGPRS